MPRLHQILTDEETAILQMNPLFNGLDKELQNLEWIELVRVGIALLHHISKENPYEKIGHQYNIGAYAIETLTERCVKKDLPIIF